MDTDVRIYHQGQTQFCTSFAFAHWLEIFLTNRDKVKAEVNPWPIVINSWRFKRYPVLNRGLNPFEVFNAIKAYGVLYRANGGKKRFWPSEIKNIKLEEIPMYLSQNIPILAMHHQHEIVIVGKTDFGYEVIDSQSRSGRRTIKESILSNFQIIT